MTATVTQTWVCDPPTLHTYDGDITEGKHDGVLPTHGLLPEVLGVVLTRLMLGFMYTGEPEVTLHGSDRTLKEVSEYAKGVSMEATPAYRYTFADGAFIADDQGEFEKLVCTAHADISTLSLSILFKAP